MRALGLAAFLLACSLLALPLSAQQTTSTSTSPAVSDPQAVALLQTAIAAMGGATPSDSVGAGNITVVAGSKTSQGTIRILTRGTSQTAVQAQTEDAQWAVTYSSGQASRTDGGTATALSLEAASTSQSVLFPLPYMASLLKNSDVVLQYLGTDTLESAPAQHVRAWNTFQSKPSRQFLASFTVADIWLDSASCLPRSISFVHRDGGGATPKIPVTIDYFSYQNVGGVLYPTQIREYVNGTLWMTVFIQSVSLNTGLTDADFPVFMEGN